MLEILDIHFLYHRHENVITLYLEIEEKLNLFLEVFPLQIISLIPLILIAKIENILRELHPFVIRYDPFVNGIGRGAAKRNGTSIPTGWEF